jgi:hypothetical protein
MFLRTAALSDPGQAEDGIADIERGIALHEETGAVAYSEFFMSLAEGYGRAGRPAKGLEVLARAFDCAQRTGNRTQESENWRAKGELVAALSPQGSTEAGPVLRRGVEVARRQGAKSLELLV